MNEFIEFVVHCIWLLIGFYLGATIYEVVKRYYYLKSQSKEAKNIKLRFIPVLKTEVHDGIIYAYDIANDTFVGQGHSLDEVAEIAYKYKKIDMALITYSNQNFWFINGKSTPVNVKVL